MLKRCGGLPNSTDYATVGAATAYVPIQGGDDVVVAGVGAAVEQGQRGHNHAWRAVATLKSAAIEKSLLQRVKLPVALESLDSENSLSLYALDRGDARAHGPAVDKYGTRSALAFSAPRFAARQPKLLAQNEQERSSFGLTPILKIYPNPDAVHGQFQPLIRHM
jgi:hypothetical protein